MNNAGVPPVWSLLLRNAKSLESEPLAVLRYITNSGGRIPQANLDLLRRLLPGTRIFLMYGLTEAFRSTYLPPEEIDRGSECIGKAIPDTEILVIKDGRAAAPGEIGELVHRGPTVALGYWGNQAETDRAYRPNPLAPPELLDVDLFDEEGGAVARSHLEPALPCLASVEDAVRLGADAVGYTLYVGSPSQAEDFVQFIAVREEAERFGMPVIIWAYPRGDAIKKKGGRDSLYAIEYAARVAGELGADVVKVNMPVLDPEKDREAPKPYDTLRVSQEEAMERVVRAAGRTLVLVSGGSKISDADLMEKARIAMDAGATGLIFGRNVWQRGHDDALRISKEIRALLLQYPA